MNVDPTLQMDIEKPLKKKLKTHHSDLEPQVPVKPAEPLEPVKPAEPSFSCKMYVSKIDDELHKITCHFVKSEDVQEESLVNETKNLIFLALDFSGSMSSVKP
jgi:hypothetical protein